MSDYIQDEWYVTMPRMAMSDYIQDDWYVTMPRMAKSDEGFLSW